MVRHKNKLLQFAQIFASRQGAFLMAFTGMIVQAWHVFYISMTLSLLDGWQKYAQAILMAVFLSGALLYFTLKSSEEMTDQAEKYRKMVMRFAWIESFVNMFYWGKKLLIDMWPNPDWMSLIIAMPFAFLLPLVLKAYGSEIRIDESSDEVEDIAVPTNIDELIETKVASIREELKDQVKEALVVVEKKMDDVSNQGIPIIPEDLLEERINDLDAKLSDNINEQVKKISEELSQEVDEKVKEINFSKDMIMKFTDTDGKVKRMQIELEEDRSKRLEETLKSIV